MRKKTKQVTSVAHVQAPVRPRTELACAACQAREEMLVHMRAQVRDLQDKLLSLVPQAMDGYQRLRMTEMAQMRPDAMEGVVPLRNMNAASAEDNFLDDLMGNAIGMK